MQQRKKPAFQINIHKMIAHVLLLSSCCFAKYSGGTGTSADPYLISKGSDLQTLGATQADWGMYFKMVSDISLSVYTGSLYKIIGTSSTSAFTGVFDGTGHSISNFNWNQSRDSVGIFGYVRGTIKNVKVSSPNINAGTGYYVGGLAGKVEYGRIIECAVIGGVVKGGSYVGGLVGMVSGSSSIPQKIENCYSTASVNGTNNIGGLVGSGDRIYHCYAAGNVTGMGYSIGGLNGSGSLVESSYWDIYVSGRTTSGGGIGKSTAAMRAESTYIGWGCDGKWKINEGNDCPRLIMESSPGTVMSNSVYWAGRGDAENPFLVRDANELYAIGLTPCQWDKCFKLINDIDLHGATSPAYFCIGRPENPFTGIFDGNNHSITNFTYRSIEDRPLGLFGYVMGNSAEIRNLKIINPSIGPDYTQYFNSLAALVGTIQDGKLTNCHVVGGNISAYWWDAGGLAGKNLKGTIDKCSSSATISGLGTHLVGGLTAYSSGTLSNCSSNVTLDPGMGGTGGLVGNNTGYITRCFAVTKAYGGGSSTESGIGGLVGTHSSGTISSSYASVDISGRLAIGGLAGASSGIIENCYAIGKMTPVETTNYPASYFGGLVGNLDGGEIRACYSTCQINSIGIIDAAGALFGAVDSLVIPVNCYWDKETSGIASSYYGTGLTAYEMKRMTSFKGFACDGVWVINEGNDCPHLIWESTGGNLITNVWYAGGTGEPNNPYLIANANQLDIVGEIPCDNTKCFKLIADIDLSGNSTFTPIKSFGGVFDGNGHTIASLRIQYPQSSLNGGLFDILLKSGKVMNLGLIAPIISAQPYTNYLDAGTGALVGASRGGIIERCWASDASVSGTNAVGILVGRNENGIINECWSSGTVTSTAADDYNGDKKIGVGGLVGWNNGKVSKSFSVGQVRAFIKNAGGLIGNNQGFISNCYSQAAVDGQLWVGGLVGYNNGNGTLLNTYATGKITLIGTNNCQGGCGGGLSGMSSGFGLQGFWDTETTGMSDVKLGTGLPTRTMKDPATYYAWAGFGWTIDHNDYPRLEWEQKPGQLLEKIPYAGGDGTQQNPYHINSPEQLKAYALYWADWDKNIQLRANLDLAGIGKIPVLGYENYPFTGTFDGQNYRISNYVLHTTRTSKYFGLFGYINNPIAVVKNIILESPDVNGIGSDYTGIIAGCLNSGKIENCQVRNGTVTGSTVGGLAAWNNASIVNSSFSGTIQASSTAGGISQYNTGVIEKCRSDCMINAGGTTGGIVGQNGGVINQCIVNGHVFGQVLIGGLVGYNYNGILRNSYVTGTVTAQSRIGGAVGENGPGSLVEFCYSSAAVNANSSVGGFIGGNYTDSVIHRCYWDIDSSGRTGSGGGTGLTSEQMKQSHNFIGWGCQGFWVISEGQSSPRLSWENLPYSLIQTQAYDGGCGSKQEPFRIDTAEQLNSIGTQTGDFGKYFILTSDINMSCFDANQFIKIGFNGSFASKPFKGIFDGQNHEIRNLHSNFGLFGYADGAVILNLNLINANINAPQSAYIGTLGGQINNSIIRRCSTRGGQVTGTEYIGGMIGRAYKSLIRECYADCDVYGNRYVGGLIGESYTSKTENCSSHGFVTAVNYAAGGLIGHNYVASELKSSFSSVYVEGTAAVGGLVGALWYDSIISKSCAYGKVLGTEFVGGLVGSVGDTGFISDCYSAADVNGVSKVGGLIGGINDGSVSNDYYFDRNLSYGTVVGNTEAGGFIGRSHGYAWSKNCFWDKTVNPTYPVTTDGITGLITADLQKRSTFVNAGWDLTSETTNGTEDIWRICGDSGCYPDLDWHAISVGDFNCPDGVDGLDLAFMSDSWLMKTLSFDTEPVGGDSMVNFIDWANFALRYDGDLNQVNEFCDQWLMVRKLEADIWPNPIKDGTVNMFDFSVFSEHWQNTR